MKAIFYDWGGLNLWLFHIINNVRGSFIDAFMLLGSRLGEYTNFPLYIAIVTIAALVQSARAAARDDVVGEVALKAWLVTLAVFACANTIDGFLIGSLKHWLDFPRPPSVLSPELLHVIGTPKYTYSLPSGHAAFAMTVAASLWPVLNCPARIGLAGYVLWVGISRVSLGMHFPADVTAGYALALVVVLILRFILDRYRHPAGRNANV